MSRATILLIVLAQMFTVTAAAQPAASGDSAATRTATVVHIKLENKSINPVTARFIRRAVDYADTQRATCLVIELDTPGGLVDSTRDIVRNILNSRTPVVVYVAPLGARAASAGLFITLASHLSAMAPGTHIGAAHPVQIGTLPVAPPADDEKDKTDRRPSPIEEKTVNDTKAWARSLAELRGRNAEWAELAVTESRSITAQAAVDEHVVDLIATDVTDLLQKLDGREVLLRQDRVQLKTKDAVVEEFEMWWGERLLGVISSPNIAFLLLVFGFYGILFEFYSPGWGVAGTLGAVLLLLGFFGLAVLPLNYAGLALLALALAMFVAEAFVVSYGALTVGGIICLILGGLMVVDSPLGFMRVSMAVVVPVAIGTGIITFILLGSVIKAHHSRVQTGSEGLIGRSATAQGDFEAEGSRFQGTIWVHGEYWRAASAEAVRKGQQVTIVDREGLTLNVEATPDSGTPESSQAATKP